MIYANVVGAVGGNYFLFIDAVNRVAAGRREGGENFRG